MAGNDISLSRFRSDLDDAFITSVGMSERDMDEIAPWRKAARMLAAATKPGTSSQLLVTFDRKRPEMMTEWTVASDAPKSWKGSDEWRLIAGAGGDMQRRKVRELLMLLTRKKGGGYVYQYATGDGIRPGATVNGNDISGLFIGSEPFKFN